MVTFVLVRHTRKKLAKDNKKKHEVTQGTIKAIISIFSVMLMFGLSWLFGALSISDGAIFFQWPFVIFNTLQGFLQFLLTCVIGKDARDEWINLLTCHRRKRKRRHSTVSQSQAHSRVPKVRTNETNLKTGSSTFRKSELSSSTINSNSEAPLCSHQTTNFIDQNLTSIAEETGLVIANDSVTSKGMVEDFKIDMSSKPATTPEKLRRTRRKSDSVLPPHVLFRLNRPYYEVIVEDTVPVELSQETDFSQDFTQTSDYDVFANLTGDSTVGLIGDHA